MRQRRRLEENGDARKCTFTPADLRQFRLGAHNGRFLLTKDQAEAIADRMVDVVRSEWHNSLRRAGVTEADCARIANAFVYEGFFYLRGNP